MIVQVHWIYSKRQTSDLPYLLCMSISVVMVWYFKIAINVIQCIIVGKYRIGMEIPNIVLRAGSEPATYGYTHSIFLTEWHFFFYGWNFFWGIEDLQYICTRIAQLLYKRSCLVYINCCLKFIFTLSELLL